MSYMLDSVKAKSSQQPVCSAPLYFTDQPTHSLTERRSGVGGPSGHHESRK